MKHLGTILETSELFEVVKKMLATHRNCFSNVTTFSNSEKPLGNQGTNSSISGTIKTAFMVISMQIIGSVLYSFSTL